MTAPPDTAPPPADSAEAPAPPPTTAVTPRLRARLRGWFGPVAFLVALLLLAVLLSWGTAPATTGDLDPEGADPDGSRAAAQVAVELGADVTVARDSATAAQAVDTDTLLVVVHSQRLSNTELSELSELPSNLLLVQPTAAALHTLVPGVGLVGTADQQRLAPLCGLPEAVVAGSADVGGDLYWAADPEEQCYPENDGTDGYALLRIPLPDSDGTATVLGSGDPLRNTYLEHAGNAALSANLLSDTSGPVVWLIPDEAPPADEVSMVDLMPAGVEPAVLQTAVALLLLALWRARRMGPLVTERLPVVVRAAETTLGRARLYRARRARGRAAAALRTGFLGRVHPVLGLARDAGSEAVVSAVAARAGRDPNAVRPLLYGAGNGPADDAALVRLADELDTLEREVYST